MKILLTGGTGFIGQKLLIRLLEKGHDVVVLTRNKKHAQSTIDLPCDFLEWDLQKSPLPPTALKGVEGVIHLAGESVASKRWSNDQKSKIRDSRIATSKNLIQSLDAMGPAGPQVLVSASAIGIYGNRGAESLSEEATLGSGFLAEVCKAWEQETKQSENKKRRLVNLRIGVVLGPNGGALAEMVPVFKMGVGGPLGSGQQYISWIHLNDLINLCVWSLETNTVTGPLNAVAPHATTNEEFSKTLAKILRKPCFIKTPALALKIGLGEMSSVVLDGQNVLPSKALKLGHQFEFSQLADALKNIFPDGADEIYEATQWVPLTVEKVFPFFSKAENLEVMTPPWLGFHITNTSTPDTKEGTLIDYKLKIHGVPVKWRTLIEQWQPPRQFVDTQLKGPYTKWHHTHTFTPLKGGTLMTDRVLYRVPGKTLGRALLGSWIGKDIQTIFNFRRATIRELVQKWQA